METKCIAYIVLLWWFVHSDLPDTATLSQPIEWVWGRANCLIDQWQMGECLVRSVWKQSLPLQYFLHFFIINQITYHYYCLFLLLLFTSLALSCSLSKLLSLLLFHFLLYLFLLLISLSLRCVVQYWGHVDIFCCEELLERIFRCHIQCLHIPSTVRVEQRFWWDAHTHKQIW